MPVRGGAAAGRASDSNAAARRWRAPEPGNASRKGEGNMKVTNIRPFRIAVPQVMIDDLGARLAATRWPEKETVDDWDQGVPLAYAQELAAYWRDRHDWRRVEARLKALPNFLATVDGLDIHFLHIPSANPAARPLILTHGWPGSGLGAGRA